ALLLVAVRGPLAFFLLPAAVLGPLARFVPLRRALHFLLRPAVSMTLWALAFGAWHIPAAYDYAAAHQGVHDLEHLSFVVAGLLVWSQLVDPTRRRRLTRGRRLGYAAALFGMGTALCDILVFSFHPLYPSYAGQAVRLLQLSPV